MNILKKISCVFLVALPFFVCVDEEQHANAAEFSIVNRSGPATGKYLGNPILTGRNALSPCHIRLEGEIREGDLERLKTVLKQYLLINPGPERAEHQKHVGLCLNSHGGSYMEAIRVAKAMLGKRQRGQSENFDPEPLRTWTVVDEKDECYSACAILFMAGNIYIEDEMIGPSYSRHLHINGRLGFHSPYLPFKGEPGTTYTADTIKLAFRQGALAVRELTKLGDNILHGGQMSDPNLMPRALINEMLATSEGDLYFIDSVGKVIAYRISLFGGKRPSKVGFCEFDNICGNHHYKELISNSEIKSVIEPQSCSKFWKIVRGKYLFSADTRTGDTGGYGGEGLSYCVLSKVSRGSGRIKYYSDLVEDKGAKLNKYSFREADWWYYYSSTRAIRSLK